MEQKILIKEMEASEGMQYITDMIKTGYLADVMVELYGGTRQGHTCMISSGVHHAVRNGQPYYYPENYVNNIQAVVHEVGKRLLDAEIKPGEQQQSDYPLCYGSEYIDKFKVLRKVIILPYLFEKVMGKTHRWHTLRLNDKSAPKYYGQFTEDELAEINNAIRTVALTLCSIKLTYEG